QLATAKRVPSDAPLVIRPRVGRWTLFYLIPLVLLLLAPIAVLVFTADVKPVLFTLVACVGLYVVGFGFRLFAQVGGGPILAADRDGVWLRAQKWPIKAVQIPWELVEEIHVKRWFVDRVLCFSTRDDR